MKKISFVIILVLSFVVSTENFNAQQIQKENLQNQKVEIKNSNNCPVACKKNCKKDPNTCPVVQRALKNAKDNKTDTIKDNKTDTIKDNKTDITNTKKQIKK